MDLLTQILREGERAAGDVEAPEAPTLAHRAKALIAALEALTPDARRALMVAVRAESRARGMPAATNFAPVAGPARIAGLLAGKPAGRQRAALFWVASVCALLLVPALHFALRGQQPEPASAPGEQVAQASVTTVPIDGGTAKVIVSQVPSVVAPRTSAVEGGQAGAAAPKATADLPPPPPYEAWQPTDLPARLRLLYFGDRAAATAHLHFLSDYLGRAGFAVSLIPLGGRQPPRIASLRYYYKQDEAAAAKLARAVTLRSTAPTLVAADAARPMPPGTLELYLP